MTTRRCNLCDRDAPTPFVPLTIHLPDADVASGVCAECARELAEKLTRRFREGTPVLLDVI